MAKFLIILAICLPIEALWLIGTYMLSKMSNYGDMITLQIVTLPYFAAFCIYWMKATAK